MHVNLAVMFVRGMFLECVLIDRKRWIESPSAFAPSVRLAFD